jgi:uncharacterized membrane protein YwaF
MLLASLVYLFHEAVYLLTLLAVVVHGVWVHDLVPALWADVLLTARIGHALHFCIAIETIHWLLPCKLEKAFELQGYIHLGMVALEYDDWNEVTVWLYVRFWLSHGFVDVELLDVLALYRERVEDSSSRAEEKVLALSSHRGAADIVWLKTGCELQESVPNPLL